MHASRSLLGTVLHDLLLGLMLYLPWPQRRRFSGDPRSTACLLALELALIAAVDYVLEGGSGATFDPYGIYALFAKLFAQVAAVFVVALAFGRVERFPTLVLGLFAVQTGGLAIEPLLYLINADSASEAFFYFHVMIVVRMLVRELRAPVSRTLPAGLITGAALWASTAWIPAIAVFYQSADGEGALDVDIDIERTYLEQAHLVEEAIGRVRPSEPAETELFFVGFAAFADEDVFENEVRHVEALFRGQLGVGDRTALLINSPRTLDALPLANAHNLAATLQGIGEKMDPEDVLFLLLTSHGTSDHYLAVEFEPLGLNDISAADLGSIVERAKLPWRVIVVSACFSGGFIEPLKSPRSVVMTAARADRMSFGCAHGRDYTYFGEALFRDSLTDRNFLGAFSRAVRIVEERETAEQRMPSEPQIWVGAEIAEKLQLGTAL